MQLKSLKTLNYLKREFFKLKLKYQQGFSLIELAVGSLITLIAATAVMTGVSSTRSTLKSLYIHERAYEELTNYTNFWKGEVGVNGWNGDDSWIISDPNVTLMSAPTGKLAPVPPVNPIMARVMRKIEKQSGGHPFPHYSIQTKIIWDDISTGNTEKSITYEVHQIEYGY